MQRLLKQLVQNVKQQFQKAPNAKAQDATQHTGQYSHGQGSGKHHEQGTRSQARKLKGSAPTRAYTRLQKGRKCWGCDTRLATRHGCTRSDCNGCSGEGVPGMGSPLPCWSDDDAVAIRANFSKRVSAL